MLSIKDVRTEVGGHWPLAEKCGRGVKNTSFCQTTFVDSLLDAGLNRSGLVRSLTEETVSEINLNVVKL